jgi:hypothetical protein
MSKANASLRILAASADIQWNIAGILEAKANEMESFESWVSGALRTSEFTDPTDLMQRSAGFHEQLLSILEGVTKVEQGLSRHMQLLLEEEKEKEQGMSFGGLFGTSSDEDSF